MISQQTLQNLTQERTLRGTQAEKYFEGLPVGVGHFDVFKLVQNLEKKIGLSSAAVQHLHYLISHTRELDWQPGAAPIVYRTVNNTATDRGRSVRQIHNLERALHRAGLIQWNDKENYKRYGRRDNNGNIVYAYGVDLTPLGRMYEHLVELNEQHIAYMEAYNETKRKVSGLRRRIVSKISLANELRIDVEVCIEHLALLPRISENSPINTLMGILNQARNLNFALDDLIEKHRSKTHPEVDDSDVDLKETSDPSEQNFRHIQPIVSPESIDIDCNQAVLDDKEGVGEKNHVTGIEHITYEMVLDAASNEFIECIQPSAGSDKIQDVVNAAARMCHQMDIGRFAWASAKSIMGDTAAAVAVVIIDRNRAHPILPVVNPGGVLRGMTAKAKTDELNLRGSLFAILSRDSAGAAS